MSKILIFLTNIHPNNELFAIAGTELISSLDGAFIIAHQKEIPPSTIPPGSS
jgi:hypothetical protein